MAKLLRFAFFGSLFFILFGCLQKQEGAQAKVSENHQEKQKNDSVSKINGLSFVASRDSLQAENILPIQEINANYAAIMPFAFIKNLEHPEIVYNQSRQWYGETAKGATQYIEMLHKNGFKIMLKPQIWVWRGEYTGLVKMDSEASWLELENSYRNFIMDFAKLAEEEKVEIFCIGTELEKFIEHRPEYWLKLIQEIRKVYKGKLTYAANWDEYKRVPFWNTLDFIGIDAYFPLSESKTPTVNETFLAWQKLKVELNAFSEKQNKKIIFTEYGYRSVDFAGKEPWKSDREMNSVNLAAQQNLLEGTYKAIWEEDWFAGGFLWKWFIAHPEVGGVADNQFTPQNKPAEVIVKKYYAKD